MLHQFWNPRIGEAASKSFGQPDRPIRLAQQQRAGVRGDRPAIKGRHYLASFDGCKFEQRRVTLCRHRGIPPLRQKALLQKNFRRFRASVHLRSLRIPG